ncbi:MAG: DUF4432 family protein [Clostridia bacterium]|nr:DUF4432 family protein [Clostridia bacterium]
MKTPEVCTKNRNYGCRIKKYTADGVEYVALENNLVRIEFSTGKGADLTSFLYKPMDVDFIMHTPIDRKGVFEAVTKASSGGSFFDGYGGGWQELFPTYGGAANYYGAEIGVHGEACIYPWETEIIEDTPEKICVVFTLFLKRSPFKLTRKYTLEENSTKLVLEQTVENTGANTYEFMWGHHPAFGFPFLDESVRIKVKGTPDALVPGNVTGSSDNPFDAETKGKWPVLKDRTGSDFRLDRAYSAKDRMRLDYVISNMEEGEIEVFNENLGIGFKMDYDKELFKHVWIWGLYCGGDTYPWYGRVYTLGVEPQSSFPADFKLAREAGEVLSLDAGKKLTTTFISEVTKK